MAVRHSCPCMQTGTGKTHTMDGGHGDTERGIIPKAFAHIFDAIQVSMICAEQA